MNRSKNSSARFALTLTAWALVSFLILALIMTIITKLDISFFEANGMLKSDLVRSAVVDQLFLALDPLFFLMIIGGLAAVAVISYLFAQSQCNYVKNLKLALQKYAEGTDIPGVAGLGPLSLHVSDFFNVVQTRAKRETGDHMDSALAKALRNWPSEPRISGNDLLQFIIVSTLLGLFFSIFCIIFFLQVANRVIELGNTVAHFTSPRGPEFLIEQYNMVNLILWTIMLVTSVTFITHGYFFGKRLSESNYALLRDLKKFMQGDYSQRLYLRSQDPVSEYVHSMNDSLELIQQKL